jgi:cyclophilin family peptidyl-prolyl cis-trans isomerase
MVQKSTPPGDGAFRPVAAAVILLAAATASAQLTPDRTYYGINRAIPMTVRVPPDVGGEAVIQLLAPVTAEVRASASVAAGGVDMAGLFPMLWKPATPPTQERVLYAQLVIGSKKVGPAVVLQPLLEPAFCLFIDPQADEPRYRPGRGGYSGLRAYIDRHVVMETTLGAIEFALRPDQAPNTVYSFMGLCEGGFYTDVIFHRVKAVHPSGAPFVIQAGDPIQGYAPPSPGPASPAEGGPGYSLNLEMSKLPHDFGVISMARTNEPNSAGSQFFICLSREGTSFLDAKGYAAFGQAVAGADTIQRIAAVEVDAGDRPKNPPVIKRCRLVEAPPYGQGPGPTKRPEAAPVSR